MEYDILKEKVDSGMKAIEIRKELNICNTTLRYWLKKHNLKILGSVERLKGSYGLTEGKLKDALCGSTKIIHVFKKLDIDNPNSRTRKKIYKIYDNVGIDLSNAVKSNRLVERECPVCLKVFEVAHHLDKVTCSYSCSNTHFRSGEGNPNWKNETYRTTCFLYHNKECVICGEDLIVHTHHLDENHENNHPNNLIPLCATHHQYWHSSHRHIIEDRVMRYITAKIDNGDFSTFKE